MTPKQKEILSKFVDNFRIAVEETYPDFEYCDKQRKTYVMTKEQLHDFAIRVKKVTLEKM